MPTARLLRRNDIPAALAVLDELRPPIAGVTDRAVYSAVCRDAAANRGPIVHLAFEDDEPAGVALAIPAVNEYWKRLAMRRPLLAVRIALARRRHRTAADASSSKSEAADRDALRQFVSREAPPHAWTAPPANSARLIYFGVLPQYRGRNIGPMLLAASAADARARGIDTLDSSIDKGNVASLRAHRRAGWQLYEDTAHIYGLCALDSQPAEGGAL